MKPSLKILLDSDVIVSSLLSSTGAAHLLINKTKKKEISLTISSLSLNEIEGAAGKLDFSPEAAVALVKKRLKIIRLKKRLEESYKSYVSDLEDAHVVAAAVKAKAKFLVSYNLRHYRSDEIKRAFDIIILSPASLLQYLRSVKLFTK